MNNRYLRQISLPEIGLEGQQRIQNSKVLVIGLGGLGSPVAQSLAACGVGKIGLLDGDTVDISNLHRQLLYSEKDCGLKKVLVAKQKLEMQYPETTFEALPVFLSTKQTDILQSYDIILDCTDNIPVRYLINDIAVFLDKTVIYASLYKFEAQISVFNHNKSASYRCVFPENENTKPVSNCVSAGVLGTLPNMIGMMQANECLKIILGLPNLSGKIMYFNSLTMKTTIFDISANEEQRKIGFENGQKLMFQTNDVWTFITKEEFEAAYNNPNFLFVDVREIDEIPKLDIENIIQIPFSSWEEGFHQISKTKKLVIYCQSGIRSAKAANFLKNKGYQEIYELKNGIQSIV